MSARTTAITIQHPFEGELSGVAAALVAGARPLGPAEITRARARRQFLRVVSSTRPSHGHHDLPAA